MPYNVGCQYCISLSYFITFQYSQSINDQFRERINYIGIRLCDRISFIATKQDNAKNNKYRVFHVFLLLPNGLELNCAQTLQSDGKWCCYNLLFRDRFPFLDCRLLI